MSEVGKAVKETLAHPKLDQLPDREVSFATIRSVMETFRKFSPKQRDGVQIFIQKAIEGPTARSLGSFGKGEATATYNLLSEQVDTPVLAEFDEKLERGGYDFRYPLAVVRSILHQRKPYATFEDTPVNVSEDVINFSLCPDAEGHLYNAMQFGGASILTYEEQPFMLAKLNKEFGKAVALPMRSVGPFVEGVLYSPAVNHEGQTTPVRRENTNEGKTLPFAALADIWFIGRPINGMVPAIPMPDVPRQDAMEYFRNSIAHYPFPSSLEWER